MDIRQLSYLVALAREKNFTKAAHACNVTQPTLSARIRQLENDLGVAIVERGQKFIGLTSEGDIVLKWANAILADCDNLEQELALKKNSPTGHLKLAVIPSALPMVARLTEHMHSQFPELKFTILSRTSNDILAGLQSFEYDAGITYIDGEPMNGVVSKPLFEEIYCTLLQNDHPLANRETISWAEIGSHDMALMTPDMQFRRIINTVFEQVKTTPNAVIETNSLVNLCAAVRASGLISILPKSYLDVLGELEGLSFVPLADPIVTHKVGLVALNRTPQPPLLTVLFDASDT